MRLDADVAGGPVHPLAKNPHETATTAKKVRRDAVIWVEENIGDKSATNRTPTNAGHAGRLLCTIARTRRIHIPLGVSSAI